MWPRIGRSSSKSGTTRRPGSAPGVSTGPRRDEIPCRREPEQPTSGLRAQGHDPVLASDVGLLSVTDARVLIFAIAQALPVWTRDSEDFEDLHDLVMAAFGHHPGILIVRFDNDPRHNLTDRGIATAISKLESPGVPIRDRIHVLNQWR
ncbi:MAG: DUF5615 family PIN-like protein [Isosphaeraceae bacterium]